MNCTVPMCSLKPNWLGTRRMASNDYIVFNAAA